MNEFEMLKQALLDLKKDNTRRQVEEGPEDTIFISCDHGDEKGMFWVMFKNDGTYRIGVPEDAS